MLRCLKNCGPCSLEVESGLIVKPWKSSRHLYLRHLELFINMTVAGAIVRLLWKVYVSEHSCLRTHISYVLYSYSELLSRSYVDLMCCCAVFMASSFLE